MDRLTRYFGKIFACRSRDHRNIRSRVCEIYANMSSETYYTISRGLITAVYDKSTKNLRLLIIIGANVDVQEEYSGKTPMHCGIDNLLHLRLLINGGADVNKCDNGKWTCLHIVAWEGTLSQVLFFIDMGADVNACNDDSNTPLHLACFNNDLPKVIVLVEAGANPHILNTSKSTPQNMTTSQEIMDFLQ